ncbi:MAG: heat-inducible transcriptional repressor HrcA [Gammaproteobacteria bacterium]|nr:heat-inducible transcriptional repressor HrcA [Gammaproteobacteria bacterium]
MTKSQQKQTLTPVPSSLDERAQALLKSLIERYLREGEPVGSRTLSRDSGLGLSPATVRNVMADLEHLGLLASPHTSAGRIPTPEGLRCFVDSMLTVKQPKARDVEVAKQRLQASETSSTELAKTTSDVLSELTKLAGVVSVPKSNRQSIEHIEFVQLSDTKILVILVTHPKQVQNRIVQLDRKFTKSELREASNYLNEHFAGKTVVEVRHQLVEEMDRTQRDMNVRMLSAVKMAQAVFANEQNSDEVAIAGEANLMQFSELSDVQTLRQLFEAFGHKRDILHLLDQSLSADGVQIFIGEESGYHLLHDCSVVVAPYTVDNEVLGVLGVIGPTRIEYNKVIPIVDVTAKMLGKLLSHDTAH